MESLSGFGVRPSGEDDKENAQAGVGGTDVRKLGDGVSGSSCDGGGGTVESKEHVLGQKRGGGDIEIEKQKSFTGSYFQVRRRGLDRLVTLGRCRPSGTHDHSWFFGSVRPSQSHIFI